MEYGVYIESSIVDLKPKVLDFLTKILDKAKEAKEYAVALKRKELAELVGRDIKTASRYLSVLEERKVLQAKGVKGRAGGTVIMFNTELVRFDTSDKAFINSDTPISLEDIVDQKLPSKKQEPKEPSRNRRTKQQMVEAKALQDKKQTENDNLNDQLVVLGGTPNWEWFNQTSNPVGNYRTYLITRAYNRYAALFTDRHNAKVEIGLDGSNKVQMVSNSYDVLPERFYGSARWNQFEKFRLFCEENNIDFLVYLSAQFKRAVFMGARKETKTPVNALPFVNALMSDNAYDAYKQYCGFQKKYVQEPAAERANTPKFMDDFVVRMIKDGFDTANRNIGVLQYRAHLSDFLKGIGDEREEALLHFYNTTKYNLRKQKVSVKSRRAIKLFLLLQSIVQTTGGGNLPKHIFLSSEMLQVALISINKQVLSNTQTRHVKAKALGSLFYPQLSEGEQLQQGSKLYYQTTLMHETPKVLQLIMERKGLHLSLADLNEAFREYGKEHIPVDDCSMLDITPIISYVSERFLTPREEIDFDAITTKRDWVLIGEVKAEDDVVTLFAENQNLL